MNKEPIGLYLFRLTLGIALLAFLVMLYWSSALVELNLKSLQNEIQQQKISLTALNANIEKINTDLLQKITRLTPAPEDSNTPASDTDLPNDTTYTNLLSEDPFYKTTLPQMLGPNFKPQGIRREANIRKPDNLHPFSNWAQVLSWINLCTVSIASQHFGKYETYSPDMATKMELRHGTDGKPEYWLHLRHDLYWEPLKQSFFPSNVKLAPMFLEKHQVTAHDFKFYIDAVLNPHVGEAEVLRVYLGDITEVKVIDDFTLVVRWKTEEVTHPDGTVSEKMKYIAKMWTGGLKPLPSFVYKYFPDGTKIIADDADPNTYRTNPVWAQNFSQHWANNVIPSCGPWVFDGMTDREIRFKRNANYYEPLAVLVEGLEIVFKDSADAIWEEFKTGSLDAFEISPQQLAELDRFMQSPPYKEQIQQGLAIKRLDYVDRLYAYIAWNEATPFFKSKKVRQALTLAIDRNRIIQQNLNGMGISITGTFFRYSPSYDPTLVPYPYDPQKARKLLEEEGWYDSTGSGRIDKVIDGKRIPFEFQLTYFVKSQTARTICDYIVTALKEIGITCTINGVDLADLSGIFENKNFEALMMGWSLSTPPEDPKQLWYTADASSKGSSNVIGFSNPEIDEIINKLEYEYNIPERIKLYHRFDKILYDEAPYIFLYTPKVALIYREYLQNVFIPAQQQELIPGANVVEPQSNIFWIKKK